MQTYGGISRYFISLHKNLSNFEEVQSRIIAPLYVNTYLNNSFLSGVTGMPVPVIPKTARIRNNILPVLNSLLVPHILKSFGPDIVHETYYSSKSYAPSGSMRVITVYDMIHERFQKYFSDKDPTSTIKRHAVNRAHHVICISNNTKNDLVDLFSIPEEKISVVYLAAELENNNSYMLRDTRQFNTVDKPYLLYVGSREGYKNFSGFLEAISINTFLKNNFILLCFGGGKFTKNENNLIRELGFSKDSVIQTGQNDFQLARIYENAVAFIFPSLYEGFGIPPLEAMSSGCPVICSNVSSIPEVVGNAGEYFDPYNPESIASAIEAVVLYPARRKELIEFGKLRCKEFSWKKCANETLNIYRSIL